MARLAIRCAFAAMVAFAALPLEARADGGAVIARETSEGFDLTVFAAPAPLRAGPADVSVLVQEGGKPVLDARVSVRWTAAGGGQEWQPPCCSMKTDERAVEAVLGHSQNKILYSAMLVVPSSGAGKLDVRVERGGREATLTAGLDARPAPSPAAAYWPWLAVTPAAIAAFALNQTLKRRKSRT